MPTSRKNYPRPAPRRQSADDKLQAETMAVVRKAAVAALRPIIEENPNKLLKLLQPHELDGMIVATIGAYVQCRAAQEAAADALNDPVDDLFQPPKDVFA